MRKRNSTTMIGRVRLKSKSAAFSKAREGGAKTKEREVAARVMDLSFESWSLRFGVMVWREGSLGVEGRELVGTRIMGFEEAMIIEAIAMVIFGGSLPLSLCVFVFVLFWLNGELSDLSREREKEDLGMEEVYLNSLPHNLDRKSVV